MDIISHSLWGGVLVGKKTKKTYLLAVLFSILPDILAEGIMFGLIAIGAPGMPGLEHGHPNITEFPAYAQNFYNFTHSLIAFSIIFILVWLLRKSIFLPLVAWGIHIIIDIPTHSIELFPTPFLWPLSNFKFDGIAWDTPVVLITNAVLLLVLYGLWFMKYRQSRKD